MGNIRKQAITSSLLVYIGFFIGAVNTYLYVKDGHFTAEQFALTRIFFDIGQNFFVFASLGVIPIILKFYPYYKSNLLDKQNDLLTWSLVASCMGFLLLLIVGFLIEPLVVKKFTAKSELIVDYYHFIFLFTLGMLFFSVLEAYAWVLQKSIVPNFLKETGLRLLTLVFILLYYFKYISYHSFIVLFSCLFIVMALVLMGYLFYLNKLHFAFKISKVSKRFAKQIISMQALIFGGMIVQALGQTMDSIFIASIKGLGFAGVYTLALYAANFIQVPQRSIQSISTGIISQAWKDKNFAEIQRIYQRSSINMLLAGFFIFGNLLLNISTLFNLLHVQEAYDAAINIFIILGIVRIIDGGTGISGTIIATSNFWKFDFFCGVVMLAIRLPLTYIFVKKFGMIGAAYSELIGYSIYNFIRFEFLRRKFNMQPFNMKTVWSICSVICIYAVVYFISKPLAGWTSVLVRSVGFSTFFILAIIYLQLTPDANQLLSKIRKR